MEVYVVAKLVNSELKVIGARLINITTGECVDSDLASMKRYSEQIFAIGGVEFDGQKVKFSDDYPEICYINKDNIAYIDKRNTLIVLEICENKTYRVCNIAGKILKVKEENLLDPSIKLCNAKRSNGSIQVFEDIISESVEYSASKNSKIIARRLRILDGNVFNIDQNSGLAYIKDLKFDGELRLPNGVLGIGNRGIGYSNISSLIIPSTAVSFVKKSITFCNNLKKITFESGNSTPVVIPTEFCTDCKALEVVELPGNISSIGPNAFKKCNKLKTVVLPRSIKNNVDAYAFPRGCRFNYI